MVAPRSLTYARFVVTRLAVAAALLAIAAVAAFLIERRRPQEPVPARDSYATPRQLVRADFPRPRAPWLVVLFSADRCESCASVRPKVAALEGPDVAVVDVEERAHRALHERYGVEAAPLTIIADADGVVVHAFYGNVSATDLWAAMAACRSADVHDERAGSHHAVE